MRRWSLTSACPVGPGTMLLPPKTNGPRRRSGMYSVTASKSEALRTVRSTSRRRTSIGGVWAGAGGEGPGDLLMREAREVAQRHDDAVLLRQARDGAVDVGPGVVARRVGGRLGGEGDGARPAPLGDGQVVSDAVQPAHQALGLAQRRQ